MRSPFLGLVQQLGFLLLELIGFGACLLDLQVLFLNLEIFLLLLDRVGLCVKRCGRFPGTDDF